MENPQNENVHSGILIPREVEIDELTNQMPMQGLDIHLPKVFNIWGEKGVGKSSFIDQLRDGMIKQKALWLHPTREKEVDTPQEFILACSNNLKYPQAPEKEKAISEALEDSQRGKVNPIQSDDSMLITRSNSAKNKKPYINQAASASVGRTEFIREDIQVSVGLGANKYDSLAEGFLDSLPLQSLGTDIIIVDLRNWKNLSIMVTDWIRDYVISTSAKGPYRRNIIFITESKELDHHTHEDKRWNEWEERIHNYRIHPFKALDVIDSLQKRGLSTEHAYFIFIESLGYPQSINHYLNQKWQDNHTPVEIDKFSLTALIPLATLDEISPEEAKAIYHTSTSKATLQKVQDKYPDFFEASGNKAIKLTTDVKRQLCEILATRGERGIEELNSSLPLARLIRLVPNKADRAKLLLLSNTQWMNTKSINEIFETTAQNVLSFIEGEEKYFISKRSHYRISERILDILASVESNLKHSQAEEIHQKLETLWRVRENEILEQTKTLKEELSSAKDKANLYNRKLNEAENRIRILEKKGHINHISTSDKTEASKNNGKLIVLFTVLAAALFTFSNSLPETYNYISFISGLASFCIALALFPNWIKYRKLRTAYNGGNDESLEEFLHDRDEINNNAQAQEAKITQLTKEIEQIKHELDLPYV